MTQEDLRRACAPGDSTLRIALQTINRSAGAVCLLTDDNLKLVGLVTDGDARRALLGGASLDEPALPFATTMPQTVDSESPRDLVLDLMRALRIDVVPEIDGFGRVVGLHTLSDAVGADPLPNVAVVMAGGKGTRLGKLTESTPKPLMQVAGRSIIERIILNLVGGGIREIYVSVNYLSDKIEQHLGDGKRFGCRIEYLRESPDNPLGTVGSLTLLRLARPDLTEPIVVMNGDLLVQFDPKSLLQALGRTKSHVTMSTRTYQHQIPFGVVETVDNTPEVQSVTEKPTVAVQINAGVYAVSREALDMLVDGVPCTMPELVQACLDSGRRVETWPISSDWIDIGTPQDLARANGSI